MKSTSPKSPRVALYCRVSTSEQDAGMQLQELHSIAAQRGWVIAGEYIDQGVSGSRTDRPELDKMMSDARSGKIDLVAVWKLDRLGRSLGHLLMILDELNSLKVGFVSHKDHGIDSTTPSGKLMLAVVGAFAAYEKEIIRQRVMSGLEKARADGIRFGRPRRDFDLKPILLLIKEGNGLKAISRMLNLPRATIRRRLVETGNWGVSKNPSKKKA